MCTRVLYETGYKTYMVGRNADWNDKDVDGVLWIFPRGMKREKTAGNDPTSWTSKYGSISLCMYGNVAADGMNEEGLVCNMNFLAESNFGDPNPGGRPTLSIGAWLQYVLDNFKTVAEAVETLGPDPFTVVGGKFGNGRPISVHWSVSDATGDSAIFEYIDCKLQIHHGRDYKVMTNSPTYDQQIAINAYWDLIGGDRMLPGTISAADRYVRASYTLKSMPKWDNPREALAAIFAQMRAVSVPCSDMGGDPDKPNLAMTMYRMYSDSDTKKYYFDNIWDPSVFWVDLKSADLSEGAKPSKLLVSGQVDYAGDVTTQFEPAEPYEFIK